MKNLYSSPKVVITTFNTSDNTNITYISATQAPVTTKAKTQVINW